MRKGYFLGAVLALFLVSTIFPLSANAGDSVRDCTVTQAGYNGETGNTEIWLYRDDAGLTKMFVAPAGEENKMLAVALTAMSSGMCVKVKMDWQVWGDELVFLRLQECP